MSEQNQAFEKCPQSWIEMLDVENLSFEKATWIPLAAQKIGILHGQYGTVGFRKSYRNVESVIVPLELKDAFKNTDWQSLMRNGPDTAWADHERFITPGCYHEDDRVRYPVIQQWFDADEPTQWHLFQELEVGLDLLRREDTWFRPDENCVEVAKLERDRDGRPVTLLFRAEHLRDYLCAKRASLLLTLFENRQAVEESFPDLKWESDRIERKFAHGNMEGIQTAIHEGGGPFGLKTSVVHVWRESVNPNDDTPEMPHPSNEPEAKSKSFTVEAKGRKLFLLQGRIWLKHWIPPATQSPRIRHDEVEARVHFQVENQEQKTLAGNRSLVYMIFGWETLTFRAENYENRWHFLAFLRPVKIISRCVAKLLVKLRIVLAQSQT